MVDEEASTVCETEFAGAQNDMTDELRARLEGLEPRNLSNFLVDDDAPNQASETDPSKMRALATRLFTEGNLVTGR